MLRAVSCKVKDNLIKLLVLASREYSASHQVITKPIKNLIVIHGDT